MARHTAPTADIFDERGIVRAFDEDISIGDEVEFEFHAPQGYDTRRTGTVEDMNHSPNGVAIWDLFVDVDGVAYTISDDGKVATIDDFNLNKGGTVERKRGNLTDFEWRPDGGEQ